jgi:hypothetical protein
LLNRAIPDFEPATRLWPVKIRLFFWILFETAILASSEVSLAHQMPARIEIADLLLTLGLPISASIAASFFSTRFVAIPDFDCTIEIYDQSIATGFRSNVSSTSLDIVVTHTSSAVCRPTCGTSGLKGSSSQGAAGNLYPMAPVTYVWFHAAKGED